MKKSRMNNTVSLKKPIEIVEVDELCNTSINRNKYNPDVMESYNKMKDIKIKDIKIEYSNETWKGITGDKMDFQVDSSESFVILEEKVDSAKLNIDYMEEFNIREQERLKIEEKNRIIKEKMLDTVMKMVDEICDDNTDPEEIVSYDILKLEGTSKGIETQHNDYNKLLSAIEKI
jgi:hypothetical protein